MTNTFSLFFDLPESCPPGRILNNTLPLQCLTCPAGKFQNISHVNPNIKCQNCVGRYIIDDGNDDREHVSCKYCPKGKEFHSTMTSCLTCPAGQFQISNEIASAACTDCPSGLYLTNTASDAAEHDQLEDCKHCPIAYEYSSPTTICKICGGGRYQDNGTSFDLTCKFCPANYFIVDDSDDADYHNSGGDCIPCQNGTFSASGERYCGTCPAGTHMFKTSNEKTECRNCLQGRKAEEEGAKECEKCAVGEYQEEKGKPYCLPCIPGTFENDTGSKTCKVCGKGQHQDKSGNETCLDCKVGRYMKGVGAVNCLDCNSGLYQNERGQVTCKPCNVGLYQDATGNTTCRDCPKGFFNQAQKSTGCNAVPPGFYNLNGTSKKCDRGYFCKGEAANQTACVP
jgi:hypothetical protein